MLDITVQDHSGKRNLLYCNVEIDPNNYDIIELFKGKFDHIPNIRLDVFRHKENTDNIFFISFVFENTNKVISENNSQFICTSYDINLQSDFHNGTLVYTASEEASVFISEQKSNDYTLNHINERFSSFVKHAILYSLPIEIEIK